MASDEEASSQLGEYIRHQREMQSLSMRRLAQLAGISNPYLSQIERGLREPSQKVVEAIARNLDVSADMLYRQAGLDPDAEEAEEPPARVAIREDPRLNPRQRQALLEVYDAFVGEGRPVRRRRRRPEESDGAGAPES